MKKNLPYLTLTIITETILISEKSRNIQLLKVALVTEYIL